ncbi:MAG: OsmC family peroxiredoxin [Planctomycetota bacterium]|nr:MAG: OsmC family peroxiredoxin [Planctomycetota bacterium]
MQAPTVSPTLVNGIDVAALRTKVAAIQADPALAHTRWSVTTHWMGGTRSDTRITGCEISGAKIERDFTVRADEPLELAGTNQYANPQELLMAALNACMTVGYVAACSLEGIDVRSLSIELSGDIDLRGFLGLDDSVKPGYDELVYTVYLQADATPAQLERVHDLVCRTSPNRFNLSQPVRLRSRLVTR